MKVNVGFSGFGPRAVNLRRQMLLGKVFKPVALFDPSQDKTKPPAGMTYYSSLDDMLAAEGDSAIDALVVASPPEFHVQQVVAGLERGLHVFSEVPMSLTMDGIYQIIDSCKAAPKAKYMLGENYEYHANVKYAAALAMDGKLGTVFYAEMEYMHDIRYRWYRPKSNSGLYAPGEDGKPKKVPWYSEMNPMMYAHSIGPLLKVIGVANGGRKPFMSVNARGNSVVDDITKAMNFTAALFDMDDGTVARAANAMAIIRKPARRCFNVYGSLGSFEGREGGRFSSDRVFLAPGPSFEEFDSSKLRKVKKIELLRAGINENEVTDWAKAITRGEKAAIDEIFGAEQCAAGICAAESARNKKQIEIPSFR